MDLEASDSSSSEDWSGSEAASVEDEAVERQASGPVDAASAFRGEKRPFEAPRGYRHAQFSNDILSTFGPGAIKKGSDKQLWCIKIPAGVSPAQLDGLTITAPSSSAESTLAHLKIDREGKGDGASAAFTQHYLLRNRQSLSRTTKSDHEQGAMTQLIAMAEGNKGQTQEQDHDGRGNEEMEALHVLLPDPSRPGQYVHAPVPIAHHMQLILKTPVDSSAPDKSASGRGKNAAKKEVTARAQPLHRLKGFFQPAGTRQQNDEEGVAGTEKKRAADGDKVVESQSSSPKKKSKKTKESESPSKKKKEKKKKE